MCDFEVEGLSVHTGAGSVMATANANLPTDFPPITTHTLNVNALFIC